jgi:very-short-patch-repair endonuclease
MHDGRVYFASLDARLVIEVDGTTHPTDEELGRDAARTAVLAAQGFAILRFTMTRCFTISTAFWRRSI